MTSTLFMRSKNTDKCKYNSTETQGTLFKQRRFLAMSLAGIMEKRFHIQQ
jgi:hypothetical protein